MKKFRIDGLMAATYTPMKPDGSLHLDAIGKVVEFLLDSGVKGMYVCGSTGEGMSLSSEERCAVAEAYVQSVAASGRANRVPVVIQVGHNSVAEARALARHAEEIGADAISATCPSYFKIGDVNTLVECMAEVASGAASLPFYYYHIPVLTGSSIDMANFLQLGSEAIPNLVGLKYTAPLLHEYQECLRLDDGRFDVVWGTDEMLLAALATGAKGAIGSTYNIMTPLYTKIIGAFESGDLETARELQALSWRIIKLIAAYPFHSAMKAVLEMLGLELGRCRSPQVAISPDQAKTLKRELEAASFFEIVQSS